jgi:hypothetical protein
MQIYSSYRYLEIILDFLSFSSNFMNVVHDKTHITVDFTVDNTHICASWQKTLSVDPYTAKVAYTDNAMFNT